MSQELAINTALAHYRIVARLGAGGMGEAQPCTSHWVRRTQRLPNSKGVTAVANGYWH
ncbi:MAG: hypothetical protein AB1757_14095 [Acidobacteriota bacterium]